MPDQSIKYALETPDGRVVWNDPADPDYVGLLDMDSGITHSIVTSMTSEQVPDGEGQRHGRGRMGGMTVTLQGSLWPDPPELLWDKEARVRAATRALDRDGTLRYTPPDGIERIARFRRMEDPAFSGRRARKAQLLLSMELPYVEAANQSSLTVLPSAALVGGFNGPITDPWVEAGAVAGATAVVNLGNRDAWPVFRIDGPTEKPGAKNLRTGKTLRVLRTLTADEFLLIDTHPTRRSVWLGTQVAGVDQPALTDVYGNFDFDGSEWWPLLSGSNDVQFVAFSTSVGAQLTVYWRHAYEGLT